MLALFKAPLWLFTLLVLAVALLAAREYFDIAEKTGFRPFRLLINFSLVFVFLFALLVGLMNTDRSRPLDGYQVGVGPTFSSWRSHRSGTYAVASAVGIAAKGKPSEVIAGCSRVFYGTALCRIYASLSLPLLSVSSDGPLYVLYLMTAGLVR